MTNTGCIYLKNKPRKENGYVDCFKKRFKIFAISGRRKLDMHHEMDGDSPEQALERWDKLLSFRGAYSLGQFVAEAIELPDVT